MKPIVKIKNKFHLKKLIKQEIKENGIECDLNHFDVSEIEDISSIFYYSLFNGDISKWDVSNVENMNLMFYNSEFNGDISDLDIKNASFNQDLSNWNVSSVNNMESMFSKSGFNVDISKWDVSSVNNMESKFSKSGFNGDISNWDIRKVNNMKNIFDDSKTTNIPYWAKIEDQENRVKAFNAYHLSMKIKNDLAPNTIKNDISFNKTEEYKPKKLKF